MNRLKELALDDLKRASGGAVDMNPYSSHGARTQWSNGYKGLPFDPNIAVEGFYWRAWERGRLALEITRERYQNESEN